MYAATWTASVNAREAAQFADKQAKDVEKATRAATRKASAGLAARVKLPDEMYQQLVASADFVGASREKFQEILAGMLENFGVKIEDTARSLRSLGTDIERAGADKGRQLANDALRETAPERLRGIVNEFAGASIKAELKVHEFANSPEWLGEIERGWIGLGAVVRQQATEGLRYGHSPYVIVERLRKSIEGLPYHAAENLTRTLYIQSLVRAEADRYTQAVSELPISRVIRIATLDPRTCMACLSLHGETMWQRGENDGEAVKHIIDHHQGRCTTITEYEGDPVQIESGEAYFAKQSADLQRRWMGPRKWQAWTAGEIDFNDFRERYDNPLYGEMMREKSLAQIREDKQRNRATYNPYRQAPVQETFTKVGGQLGSNPGGQYEDQDGKKYYVKFMDEDRIRSELAANDLYRMVGVDTPVTYQREVDGKPAMVSEWIPGTSDYRAWSATDKMKIGAARGLPADMWLANWDVAAPGNLQVDDNGRVYRIEAGGALEYRAQGEKKGRKFTKTKVKELDTFFQFTEAKALMDSALSTAQGRKAFFEGYEAIANIKGEDVFAAVKDKALADKMVKRAAAMRKQKKTYFKKIRDLYEPKAAGAKDWPLAPGELRELDKKEQSRLAKLARVLKKKGTARELEAVEDFTGGGFTAMNNYMLKKTEGWKETRKIWIKDKVKKVEKYIAKFVGDPPQVVWRGNTGEWAEYLANKEVGDVVDIYPLTSTSLDVGVAMNFAKIGKEGEGRVLEIIPRKGGAYVGIRGVSSYDADEKEWIMRPNHKIRKVGVEKIRGRRTDGTIVEIEVDQYEEIDDDDDV